MLQQKNKERKSLIKWTNVKGTNDDDDDDDDDGDDDEHFYSLRIRFYKVIYIYI